MPSDSPKKQGFEPLHKGHAIEQVAIAIIFEQELDDDKLKAAKDAVGKPEELPGYVEVGGLSFSFGGPIASSPPITPSTAGHLFRKVRPDGAIETELHVQRSTIVFRTLLYPGWTSVWAQVRKYHELLLPIFVDGNRIAQLSLNYVDKFIWNGSKEDFRPADILKDGSPYLAPTVFGANDLWHSHTGAFTRADQFTKRLASINVDCVDLPHSGENRRALVIKSMLVDMFNQPGYGPTVLGGGDAVVMIDAHAQALHALDKTILGGIINAELAQRIALTT